MTENKDSVFVEDKILQIISKNGSIDFMTLRAHFPISTTNIEKLCKELRQLELIEIKKNENETNFDLTDKGAQAITLGLRNWIKKKTLKEIANNSFILTKSTSNLERYEVKVLENQGEIYHNGKIYKIVPGQKNASNLEIKKRIHSSTKAEPTNWKEQTNNWYKNNETFINIIVVIATIIGAAATILGLVI